MKNQALFSSIRLDVSSESEDSHEKSSLILLKKNQALF